MDDVKASPPEKEVRFRSRTCMFVLYPESQQLAIEYAQQNFPCAWYLHDADVHTQSEFDRYVKKHEGQEPEWKPGELKKPHMHFVCSFKNARWYSSIAKALGVSVPTICRVNNLYKAYVYLWHGLDPDKAQYDPAKVGLNPDFVIPSEYAHVSADEADQLQVLLDMPAFGSFNEMVRWVYENGCWAVFKKNYAMWRDIFLEHRRYTVNQELAKQWEGGFIPLGHKDPFATE